MNYSNMIPSQKVRWMFNLALCKIRISFGGSEVVSKLFLIRHMFLFRPGTIYILHVKQSGCFEDYSPVHKEGNVHKAGNFYKTVNISAPDQHFFILISGTSTFGCWLTDDVVFIYQLYILFMLSHFLYTWLGQIICGFPVCPQHNILGPHNFAKIFSRALKTCQSTYLP